MNKHYNPIKMINFNAHEEYLEWSWGFDWWSV